MLSELHSKCDAYLSGKDKTKTITSVWSLFGAENYSTELSGFRVEFA